MALNKKLYKSPIIWVSFSIILLIQACASMQQPQGGPKDLEPPKILSETPANYSKNFAAKKIIFEMDEYFKLSNEYSEISISPTQELPPAFRIKQKKLEIELKDTLEQNTTYTINFGKAVSDVNESNLLKNYSYVFATGDKIDSLQISGKVINSNDNKIVAEATVFILPTSRDSLFGKKRAPIFTITDTAGNFHLKNLKEGDYRLYALNEEGGGDRIYNNPKEEIGFSTDDIKLVRDTGGIVIKLFKEIPDNFRFLEKKIESDGKIILIANKPIENPKVNFLQPTIKDPIISYSAKGDTTQIWIKELTFDSLKMTLQSKDTLLDSVTIKRGKRDTYTRNIVYSTNMSANKIKPGNPLILTFNLPIENIDKSKVQLYQDTLRLVNFNIESSDPTKRIFKITHPWKTKKRYTIDFQENAINDIYETKNKPIKTEFELDEIENYGNLTLSFLKEDSVKNYIVQLLNEKGDLVKDNPLKKNSILNYPLLSIGKYNIKIIEDSNNNDVFDTGNVKRKEQPEKSWFFEKEIIIRANWEREEIISIPKNFD